MSLLTGDVISGFKVMIYGLLGVFVVLIVFYLVVKILFKVFPENKL